MSEVTHPTHGRGKVLRSLRGGRYYLVRFEGQSAPWQVRESELTWDQSRIEAPARPASPKKKKGARNEPTLKTLEALRLGVVPSEGVEVYTVGRDVELAMVRSDLEAAEGSGAARVILGDYGTGKTHLLEVIESMALERNFVVSRLVLDNEEVSPSHPKRVYRSLVQGLTYPDLLGRRGLTPLFEQVQAKVPDTFFDPVHPSYHRYLSPFLAYYRELEGESDQRAVLEEAMDFIEGHPSLSNVELERELRRATRLRGHRLFALMDYRPWAHLYTYLVGGISYLIQQAGYRGLAILFDEAEFYALLSSAGREFADLLFGYYSAAALGPDQVRFDLESAPRGGHAVHRSFPPLYREAQHLYCVFAMTDDPKGLAALERILEPDRFACLSPLRLQDYQELCRRVIALYQVAYPDLEVGELVQNPMGEVVYQGVQTGAFENPRQVLKFVMELLDFSRLRRDQIPAYVKEVLSYLR
ncbi:MAG: DUF2791 family P-loop domain-containing protein [Candidatus Eremiobacteraeota bacterium]|nr:DUF2791 family P-loop domain-containing protein [Candidatus Eremiobacteraeota bacterium]